MITFHELLESGLVAEKSRNLELGEVFDHMC